MNVGLDAMKTRTIKGILRRARGLGGRLLGSGSLPPVPHDPDVERKTLYAQAVLNNGRWPTNFSVNLGAAPCNHSCLFCPQSVEKPGKAQWLDLDLLHKVLDEMPEEHILLNVSSYSETIAAPNLVPAVRLMKRVRPNLPIAMATNGSIFREEVIAQLIDAGLDQYSYSFDGATRAAYSALMQKDDFDKAWANLERIVDMRNRKRSPMKITTHIMHFKGVEVDFERFKAHWEGKVDAVVLRRVGNWGSDDLGLMRTLATKGFVSAHPTPAARFPCVSIFMHFKLQYDGHYYPCVAAVPAYDKHLVPPLGHAREQTWTEAWERLGAMREAHLAGRWDDYACCRSCNIWSMWDDMWFRERGPDGAPRFHARGVDHAR